MSFRLATASWEKFQGNGTSGSSIEETIFGSQTGAVDNCLLEANSDM